jgi:uncharacterized protein with von Willebrand factor type A (vWA) domain
MINIPFDATQSQLLMTGLNKPYINTLFEMLHYLYNQCLVRDDNDNTAVVSGSLGVHL